MARHDAHVVDYESHLADQFTSGFDETKYNGRLIDWRYWIGQMPILTAAQASRLMSGLEPDVFAELSNRPTTSDPSHLGRRATSMERLARLEGIEVATAPEWLNWAKRHRMTVNAGFRLAVQEYRLGADAALAMQTGFNNSADASTLPTSSKIDSQDRVASSDAAPPTASAAGTPDQDATAVPTQRNWRPAQPRRFPGYRVALFAHIKREYVAGRPCPTAHSVLEAWRTEKPIDVIEVMRGEIKYYGATGNVRTADLKAIQQAIKALVEEPANS